MGSCSTCQHDSRPAECRQDSMAEAEEERRQSSKKLLDVHTFTMVLHSAHLARSFAKFGWMNPYAVITVDDAEVGRTKPDTWAHKDPTWNASYTFEHKGVPETIKVSIWDMNHFHKHVFCGSVTVPCDVDMGEQIERDFTLTKHQKPTGLLTLTLSVSDGSDAQPRVGERIPTGLGDEMDHVVMWTSVKSRISIALQERTTQQEQQADSQPVALRRSSRSQQGNVDDNIAPALIGDWRCVDTHGLDEFLKATGVGMFQRKIAKAAKWPSWTFFVESELLVFINHSAIGELKEEIPLGTDYKTKDGHGNSLTCKTEWEDRKNGGLLITTRTGDIGSYKEERLVEGDKLTFTLTHGTGISWGRVFEREK